MPVRLTREVKLVECIEPKTSRKSHSRHALTLNWEIAMDTEFEGAPACCRRSIEQIRDKLETTNCLDEFLALSPSLTKPMLRVSILGVLWRVGQGVLDWRKVRKLTSKTLQPIVENRIRTIIDFELLQHSNDSELSKQWSRLRQQLTS